MRRRYFWFFSTGVHQALLVKGKEKCAQYIQRQQYMKVKTRVRTFTVSSTVALVSPMVLWDERLSKEHVSAPPSPSELCLSEETNRQVPQNKVHVYLKHQKPRIFSFKWDKGTWWPMTTEGEAGSSSAAEGSSVWSSLKRLLTHQEGISDSPSSVYPRLWELRKMCSI